MLCFHLRFLLRFLPVVHYYLVYLLKARRALILRQVINQHLLILPPVPVPVRMLWRFHLVLGLNYFQENLYSLIHYEGTLLPRLSQKTERVNYLPAIDYSQLMGQNLQKVVLMVGTDQIQLFYLLMLLLVCPEVELHLV